MSVVGGETDDFSNGYDKGMGIKLLIQPMHTNTYVHTHKFKIHLLYYHYIYKTTLNTTSE